MDTKLVEMLEAYRAQLKVMRDLWVRFSTVTYEEMFEYSPRCSKQMGLVTMWNQAITLYVEDLPEPARSEAWKQVAAFLDEEDQKDRAAGIRYPGGEVSDDAMG